MRFINSKWIQITALGISVLLALACGAGAGTTADGITDSNDTVTADKVSSKACLACHSFQGDEYIKGKHANHSTHINALSNSANCLSCHSPSGEGPGLEPWLYSINGNVPAEGLAVVGCEDCHGNGGKHFGVGDIPSARPDYNTCGKCHDKFTTTSHQKYHSEGNNILTDFASSAHAKSLGHWIEDGDTEINSRCAKCHSDEYGSKYANIKLPYKENRDFFGGVGALSMTNASSIQCRTCHNPHDTSKLLLGSTLNDDGSVKYSAEFNTCTTCHQTFKVDVAGGNLVGLTEAGLDDSYHNSYQSSRAKNSRSILDTHFDINSTSDNIEGYVIDPSSERSCRDCHNVHSASTNIHTQWSKSQHGNLQGEAWAHYDFKADNRQSCQRCHTATGYKNYVSDMDNYDASQNSFHASGNLKEVLYCWGCHTDNQGTTRSVSEVTVDYESFNDADTTDSKFTYADAGKSNMCIACHSGRGSGHKISQETSPAGKNFAQFNAHYLAAASVLYRSGGYQYSGQSYDDPSYFKHSNIGTSASEELPGTSGPCISCHMSAPNEGHTFEPVTKVNGVITAVNTNDSTCSKCHTRTPLTPDFLNSEKAGFENIVLALKTVLSAQGVHYASSYPYFFDNNAGVTSSGNRFSQWASQGQLGAAYNYNLLSHEPGSWAHNRFYTKRLLFDSLDFLDNGVLDGTIDLSSYAAGAAWMKSSDPASAVTRP